MTAERLQKVLAQAGFGSRRGCEELLRRGRVRVDGRVATLGERADPGTQRIEVDGVAIAAPRTGHTTIALHKPRDYVVTARDELGRQTVYDLLPDPPPGLRYAGRLDRDSEGLLLLSTDGELINRITHPRYEIDRIYDALLDAEPEPPDLEALRRGVQLEDGPARAHEVRRLDRKLVRLTLREGRNREVRRMFAARGLTVVRLVRRSVGPVGLGSLAPGAHRPLSEQEERRLRRAVGLTGRARASGDSANSARATATTGRSGPDRGGDLDAAEAASLSSADRRSATDTGRADAAAVATGPAVPDPAEPSPTAAADGGGAIARSIALDGAAASGKSVVGRALAEALNLGFFDTGLMYRACTLAVLQSDVDPTDAPAVTALVRGVRLDVAWPDPATPRVQLGGEDVTDRLRQPEVERTVSLVSGIPDVRDELVRRQRAIAADSPVVMAGRDIGTRVLAEARTKIFLDASSEVRARRRLAEELERGADTTFERVLQETRQRDEADATGHRAIRREQAAPDAIVIDTDASGIDQVVTACIEAYRAANGAHPSDTARPHPAGPAGS